MKNIIVISNCRSGHNFVMNQIRSWDPGNEFKIHNFEDVRPMNYTSVFEHWCRSELIDPTPETINIIVIRDLLNWWASYLKWITKRAVSSNENLMNAFEIWTEQAQEAFELTNHIPNPTVVIYDEFNDHRSCREHLCDKLGGKYSESVIDHVPEAGGGSSFDTGIPGQQMMTYRRYQNIINSPLRNKYFEMLKLNTPTVELYEQHFEIGTPRIATLLSMQS